MAAPDSGSVAGVDVPVVYDTGKTISGRSQSGGASATGLKTGLSTAGANLGHPRLKAAATGFVTNHVMDNANKLPGLLTSAGHNVSNVGATARDSDNEGARVVEPLATNTQDVGALISHRTKMVQ